MARPHPPASLRSLSGLRARLAASMALVLAIGLWSGSARAAAEGPRKLPSPMVGVTVDTIAHLPETIAALAALPVMPVVRIVFDRGPVGTYTAAVEELRPVAYVMGELVDSSDFRRYTLAAYRDRARSYYATLRDKIDLWEIGNEVNGEWLGPTKDVVAKLRAAFRHVEQRGGRTAMTLYFNQDCWEKRDHEMFSWTEKNVPAEMKAGLDYVFVSWYPDDCRGVKPDWPAVFTRLRTVFPTAKLGFGEIGRDRTAPRAAKARMVRDFYGMERGRDGLGPRFVGGFFWWYFAEEMVPRTKPLWRTLSDTVAAAAR
jgi:hypothetical protein